MKKALVALSILAASGCATSPHNGDYYAWKQCKDNFYSKMTLDRCGSAGCWDAEGRDEYEVCGKAPIAVGEDREDGLAQIARECKNNREALDIDYLTSEHIGNPAKSWLPVLDMNEAKTLCQTIARISLEK